jgi:hypothetical protein
VGRQANLDISESYSKGDVYNKNTQNDAFAGGITGWLTAGSYSINHCYSLGNITAEYTGASGRWAMAGGILGTTSSNPSTIGIRYCYAAGIIKAIFNGTGSNTNLISGGIAGELYNYQESIQLVNNMYLGSSVQTEGPGNRHIHFLYAYGPNADTMYTGWRWENAKREYSSTAGGSLTVLTDSHNFDGQGDAANTVLNTTWPDDLGFISSTWGNYTDDFSTLSRPSDNTRGIKRPKLEGNPE